MTTAENLATTTTAPSAKRQARRILIVEDEEDILDSLSVLVGTLDDVVIRKARDGKEGLRILTNERIDLLITDHRMPRMNGLELLRMLNVIAPGVPSIMVTAYPDEMIEDFARRVPGFTGLLPKPCDPALLLQHVDTALRL